MDALLAMGRAPAASATLYEAMANSDLAIPISTSSATVLLVNGACYFGYLQWSFIVGSKVSLVTHAVCNAMRRPVNIVSSRSNALMLNLTTVLPDRVLLRL